MDNKKRDFRPKVHFTPPAMVINDPNGLVYADGVWHLFYQYYPYALSRGAMHWGHAVSKDLLHWQHLPVALYPDELGCIFSGSCLYDRNNASRLGGERGVRCWRFIRTMTWIAGRNPRAWHTARMGCILKKHTETL